jgi:maleate isomerase
VLDDRQADTVQPPTRRLRLGVLTPSSNTALEPLTAAMVAGVPGVSAHFARFRVTRIGLDDAALGQFDDRPILEAAQLLADAKVDAIGWSGTAAGWLGFDHDERLCARIEAATGSAATTSVLALNALLARFAVKRLALVTPYTADVQARIAANYRAHGIETVAERHLDIATNFDFGLVDEAQLDAMVDAVAAARPEAIVPYCTNLRAAQRVPHWEARHGIPVFDTVTTVVWQMLQRLGAQPALTLRGWGGWVARSG